MFGAALGLDNGYNVPALGWSSWNTFRKGINETMLLRQADAMVSSGMRDAGYTYINLDAGWSAGRDDSGELQPNRVKFPEGMRAFADKIHARGLKLGIYTAFHISWNHEDQDAQRFANWTCDYVKNDWVYNSHNDNEAEAPYRFRLMRDALNRTGRPMFYSGLHTLGQNRFSAHGKQLELVLSIFKMGCADTVPFQPKPNIPF